ncbi:Pol polyprotein, partial [Mucuna pruriens]
MIGPIEPKASNGHRFILVEAASYANVTKSVVIKFIKRDIICRVDNAIVSFSYLMRIETTKNALINGLPTRIITDNGTNLKNKMMAELCEQFRIKHHNSTPYRPKMNGAVEAAHESIKKIVQKMVVTYRD